MKIKETSIKFKTKFKKYARQLGIFFGLRQTKYGLNMLLAVIALLGILALINFIVYKENVRWDLTKSKKFTLSEQTKNVLSRQEQEIKITAFYQSGAPDRQETENLLKEYQAKNKKIKVEFIDPDEKPAIARKYGVERYGTLVLEMGEKKQQVTDGSESDITSAILKLGKEEKKNVYFLTGHGEKTFEQAGEKSYSSLKTKLEKENFLVKILNLIVKPEMPKDISVLVIASPQKRVLDKEKELIHKYLDEGGKALILLDPKSEVKEDVGLSDLFDSFGVSFNNNLVIDPQSYFLEDVGTVVISKWTTHKITEKMPGVFFPGVAEVAAKKDAPKNLNVISLGKTTGGSWLEVNTENRQVKFDKDKDKKGPISVAVVVEKEKKEDKEKKAGTRLVIIGDSDFAVDSFADILSNQDLFINSIAWLSEAEELISIRPKEAEDRKVALTGGQAKTIFYLTVIGMPLIVIVAGVLVWVKRKKKKYHV